MLIKAPTAKQLLRACLIASCFTFIFGFKDSPVVMAACPLLTMMYLLTPDLTPFATATALIVNLAIKHELQSWLPWYSVHQLALICLGGAYERIILSDYFSKSNHGR